MGVYKHNNGNWYCRGQVKGERYHVPCTGANNRNDAKAIEDGVRYRLRLKQNGMLPEDKKKYSISVMMDIYIKTCEANKLKTLKQAKSNACFFIEYFGKNKNIESIKPIDIEEMKMFMQRRNNAPATINRYLAALKRAYNIMKINKFINCNPVCEVDFLEENNSRYQYLTKEEWHHLKAYMPKHLLYICAVAILTGFRRGNVLNLKWEFINLELRYIQILKLNNKGKKEIFHPISDALYEILMTLEPQPSGYVFTNPKTGTAYKDIKRSWHTALKRAGIKDLRFHDLRRTMGTWLLEEGTDIRTIQVLLTHTDIRTTERYLALSRKRTVEAVNKLNNFI